MFVKKLASLSLALALVYSISFPARAELLKNFKADGSIETRSFGINNETDRTSATDDYRSETRTRLMVGGSFDLLDDVHSRVQLLKNNRIYGAGGTTAPNNPGQGENLNTVQSAIDVANAYVKIDKVFNHVDLTMGRQFYGRSDDLVVYFGPNNDDILSVLSLDTFRADADIMGVAKVQGIAGKIADVGGNINSDTDVIGAEVNTDKIIPKGNLAAYFYDSETKGAGVAGNNNLEVYGLRATGDLLLGLSYNAEGILNGGRDSTSSSAGNNKGYNGNAYLLALKWANEIVVPLRASAEYGRGTDNFRAISAGKRFGIIYGEHTTVGPASLMPQSTGLADLKVVDLSVGANPMKKLGVDLSWYRFMADARTLAVGNKTSVGTEYDLVVSWKHSENVALEANAASFQVGDALRPATGSSPITRLGADVKIKF